MSRTATPHRTASAALLCATLFVPVATGQHAAAAPDQLPAEGPQSPPGRAAARVEQLYKEAGAATRAFEKARKQAEAQRAKTRKLRKSVAASKARLRELRSGMGRMARSQYRNGGLTQATKLLFSTEPESFLERTSLLRKGDHAMVQLFVTVNEAQRTLTAEELKATKALAALKEKTERQNEIRADIATKLAQAQERLRRVRAEQRPGPLRPMSVPGGTSAPGAASGGEDGGAWVKPVKKYTLSSGFASAGARWSSRHTGQDFAVPVGTPVRAAGGGTVQETNRGDAFGNSVVLRHPNGYYTQYAHLSSIAVAQGQTVKPGQRIGLSGNTGNSTGPHLHFEVRVTPQMGSAVNPLPWLREHGVTI
ncbi:peptidoglycan DD-metalloendopeptidase family protein [Streptomyces sp. HNM0574]|uniref:M23 family metallopeptidase n=1 Tax=Streptomyces sp. HNM0574 TaxID=2714954 RepID=UPI00146A2F0E|nr:peptidoglycan DD-metalloendopeptidase family protein [Streptomyces sp. HNM0574]NLU67054.1 peptidoglycan DD-metalloendopeptidase family protein [Streptomyces sp. HNM0574]